MTDGIVIAAPASGSGKTVVTIAILRALRRTGFNPGSLKIGPDYIDPGFHRQASGGECRNYDPWAMRPATLDDQLCHFADKSDIVIVEGVTGLFDGASDGSGSTADAAERLGWPILLIVDVRGLGASVAALVEGFSRHRATTRITGVILNCVGSDRHRRILENALKPTGISIVGMIPRALVLEVPDRHLGLVQSDEQPDLESQIDRASSLIEQEIDIAALKDLAESASPATPSNTSPVPPPGQYISVARDDAFSFTYPHILDGWHNAGAEIAHFSPLADEAPDPASNAVYLPGGYPELYASRLAANHRFLDGLRHAAKQNATIYGECGGFMVLGETLTDRDGRGHTMAGLLPIQTSFAEPKMHLGYRKITLCDDIFLGNRGDQYRGHEFHYSMQVNPRSGPALFELTDATDAALVPSGCRLGTVMGAYCHVIDRA